MPEIDSELTDIRKSLEVLARRKMMSSSLECELELAQNETVLTANRAALLHIANRIIKLVDEGVAGSHFTIDKADIAPDSKTSLTVSLI